MDTVNGHNKRQRFKRVKEGDDVRLVTYDVKVLDTSTDAVLDKKVTLRFLLGDHECDPAECRSCRSDAINLAIRHLRQDFDLAPQVTLLGQSAEALRDRKAVAY